MRYALNQIGAELGRFLDDARVPWDTKASERSRRRIALGHKNYLFVGDVEVGASIAGLYTLIAMPMDSFQLPHPSPHRRASRAGLTHSPISPT